MYYSLMETTVTNPARVARWFHALSDETRLRIVDLLQRGERCVCELQDALGAAQSRLSFHLKVLREAGLVNDRKQGRWNFYSLRPEVLDEMAAYLQERKPDEEVWSSCACGEDHTGPRCA
ncbi:MAG TPA: metalloregulator ArsR/SmtB family transcription factor [Longimicrobiaceae bacterium]